MTKLSVFFIGLSLLLPVAHAETNDKPALVVVIAIDQLRRDRLDADMQGGLGKILSGREYTQGQLDHGVTTTCPGHVVMLTGSNPSRAGVPGNSFVDRETYEARYCVDDADAQYQVLGGTENRSPRNIRVDALGDWLKASDERSKVFSIAGKDRAAIALGGQNPDGVYWYHKDTGNFTSSGYYTTELPGYLKAFNGNKPELDGHIATLPDRWEHQAGDFRVDDFEGENDTFLRVSGHPVKIGDEVYNQVYASPYLDKQTLEVASMVAEQEKLGEGEATDLLVVALSATDIVGHFYGPRSGEAIDALEKVDVWLGEFLKKLENRLGEGRVLIALSADHGVAELPEYITEQDQNSCPEQGRLSVNKFIASLYWNIYKEFTFPFGRPDELVVFGGAGFTINKELMAEHEIDEAELVAWLDDYLTGLDVVKQAWTRAEIQQTRSDVARLLTNSFVEDRSGDVMVQLEEDCILFPDHGTTHGSVYAYDRDVPVVFYGWQVEAGQSDAQAYSVDIGPSLAAHLGIKFPADRDGKVLRLRAGQ